VSTTPEGAVKRAVKKRLKELGVYYFMPVQNGLGRVGIPDFICCYKGRFIAIETKRPGARDKTTPNQDREIAAINSAGGVAVVVDDVSQIEVLFTC
jgi:hypothetical protein